MKKFLSDKRFWGAILFTSLLLRFIFLFTSTANIHVSGDESIAALQAIGITQNSASPVMQAKQHPRGVAGRFPLLFMGQPYLFPLESTLYAPFIRLLPNSAFGVRLLPFCMGLITLALSLALLRRWGSWEEVWPAALLILFPSSYLLMMFHAYGPPSYHALMLFSALGLYLAQLQRESNSLKGSLTLAALCGFCGGINCSGTLLALPVLAATGAMVCLGKNFKECLRNTPVFVLFALIGLTPYFMAKAIYPGSYAAVSSLVPITEALGRIWDPALTHTLPYAMGFRCTVIIDALENVGFLPDRLSDIYTAIWLLIITTVTLLCLKQFVQRSFKARWPNAACPDLIAGLSWIGLILFVLNQRFGYGEYRYLAPVVWCFPFALAHLYLNSKKMVFRRILAGLAMAMVLINIVNAVLLLQHWKSDDFDGHYNDARPAIAKLKEMGIDSAYASYFDAYSIGYLSNEEIVCSQPYNERFFGWPLPYKDLVDQDKNAAYVMGPSQRFKVGDFLGELNQYSMDFKSTEAGKFTIFYGFSLKPGHEEQQRLNGSQFTCHTTNNAEDAQLLNDGEPLTRWRSHAAQQTGMAITVELNERLQLSGLIMYYPFWEHDRANALKIDYWDGQNWQTAKDRMPSWIDDCEIRDSRPLFGQRGQTIRFPEICETNRLRISILEPKEGHDWAVGEIVLLTPP